MLWVALLLPSPDPPPPSSADALRGVVLWCLQFTPRVTVLEPHAVAMEVAASLRLFHGRAALKARIDAEAPALGVTQVGWGPTARAALVLARCQGSDLGDRGLQTVLDALPLLALTAAAAHAETLARMGIRTLGDLRALPREGVSRRFGADVLRALDQAYGLRSEAFQWEPLPEHFSARLELPARETQAPALLRYARPLLMQMCAWLCARHSGAQGFSLHWVHDSMRAKEVGEGGSLTVRSCEPLRDLDHFCRLLAEHLALRPLLAPVGELRLEALDVHRITEESASLLPEDLRDGEPAHWALERIAARLGADRVRQPILVDDHRPEWKTQWQPAPRRKTRPAGPPPELPAPTFLLSEPLRLQVRDHRPYYQGPLILLIGPDRVEGGWWDRVPGEARTRRIARDYWVAISETLGPLWIFSARLDDGDRAWFLHGTFA